MTLNPHRRGYELRTLFFSRPIRPFHLAVTLSTGAVGVANTFFGGVVLGGPTAAYLGVFALASAVLLTVGWWWWRNEWCAEWGLLLAAGVWASRATFAWLQQHSWFAVTLSLAWFVGAAGAYMLERYDHQTGSDHAQP